MLEEVFKQVPAERIVGAGIGQIGQALNSSKNAAIPSENIETLSAGMGDAFRNFATPFRLAGMLPNLKQMTQFRHHLAHMYSAFCPSSFDSALIVSVDGNGEYPEAVVVGLGSPEGCEMVWQAGPKTSLGTLYRIIGAQFCGLSGSEGEGKAMALAAYGKPVYKKRIKEVLLKADPVTMEPELLQPVDITETKTGDAYLLRLLESHFGPRRLMKDYPPDTPVEPFYADMAASVQALVEEYMLNLVRHWVEKTGRKNLCLAGGVAMNSAMNGVILRSGFIDDLFVQPASSDNGLALGAAYGALYNEYPNWRKAKSRFVLRHTYYGTPADDVAIQRALDVFGLPVKPLDDPVEFTAARLAENKIVGWFRGRMEFGARSLGNRSILCLATEAGLKDDLNLRVKNREAWRPFAPATLKEKMGEYFDLSRHEPFMTVVYNAKAGWAERLPGVMHVDGTARVQSVDRRDNPDYYRLIERVGEKTGVSVILNTSLNGKGHPIARTPGEALALFLNSDMDCLVLGNYALEKGDKIPRSAYENDALSILLELSGDKPYVAMIVKNNNPLNSDQEAAVYSAIQKTGGIAGDSENVRPIPGQTIWIVMGEYERIKNNILLSLFSKRDAGQYVSVKCAEFLSDRIQIRVTGQSELIWPLVDRGESNGANPVSDQVVFFREHRFEKITGLAPKKPLVLWPMGTLTGKILSGESPLNGFKDNALFCVDAVKTGSGTNVPVISSKEFIQRLALGSLDPNDFDLIITSVPFAEEIFYSISSLMESTNVYLLNDQYELFKLRS